MEKKKTIEAVLERKAIEATLNQRQLNTDIYKATGDLNYEHLINLPKINGTVVIGEKVSHDYHLADEGEELNLQDVTDIFNNIL